MNDQNEENIDVPAQPSVENLKVLENIEVELVHQYFLRFGHSFFKSSKFRRKY